MAREDCAKNAYVPTRWGLNSSQFSECETDVRFPQERTLTPFNSKVISMLVRTAFWIGEPKPGRAEELKAMLNNVLIPEMRQFPGVASIKVLWPKDFEDSPPNIFCQVFIEYSSAEAMQQMMECRERAALRPQVLEAVSMFDGAVSHINYEVA